MRVLMVVGSPHKEGCVYTALCEVASALNAEGIDTDFFWIGNKPIGGCIGCHGCAKKHRCVFDDKVNEFLSQASAMEWTIYWKGRLQMNNTTPTVICIPAKPEVVRASKRQLRVAAYCRVSTDDEEQQLSLSEIDSQLEQLNTEFSKVLAEASESGDQAVYSDKFREIMQKQTALKAQRNEIQRMLAESGKAADHIDQCRQAAEVMPVAITEWDEALIRQVVESVTVETDGGIVVALKSGASIHQELM